MRKAAKIYILLCILAGMGALIYLTVRDAAQLKPMWAGILFFTVLGVIAESQSVAIDEDKALSIAFAIDIAALLLFGLTAAVWVSFCTAFFSVMDFGGGHKEHLLNTPLYKSLMNASNYILSTLAFGLVFEGMGGYDLTRVNPQGLEATFLQIIHDLPAIGAGLVVYVLANTLIIIFYFYFLNGPTGGLLAEWLQIFRWSVLSMILIGVLGVFLTVAYHVFGYFAVLLFFAPFLLFRYVYVGFTSIQKGYIDTIKAFSAALEAKDTYTIGHARRVEKYCELIAKEMHLSPDRTKVLRYASLLHDIGKIGISESILNKEAVLNDEEYREIQKHPSIGAQMLEGIPFLEQEVRIIRAHHLYFNGEGYPKEAIQDSKLLESQILCVADSFDAMTSTRAYRDAMSLDEAIEELKRNAGIQFAPDVVHALIRGLNRLREKNELEGYLK